MPTRHDWGEPKVKFRFQQHYLQIPDEFVKFESGISSIDDN
jgi:hypothetical protein